VELKSFTEDFGTCCEAGNFGPMKNTPKKN